jgi:excisionase family DNA binding protein
MTIIDQLRARKGYVTSTAVMELLGISRQTLWSWISEGRIQAVRIGKTYKFDPAHLIAWLEARTLGSAT